MFLISYDHYGVFNLTKLEETYPNGTSAGMLITVLKCEINFIAGVIDLMSLSFTLVVATDTDNTTGNIHRRLTMTTTMPNGASMIMVAETWSQGFTKPYGVLNNTISPNALEV